MTSRTTGCERTERVAEYVLRAVPASERSAFEAHVDECPECREELAARSFARECFPQRDAKSVLIGARIGGIPELIRENETGACFASGQVDSLRIFPASLEPCSPLKATKSSKAMVWARMKPRSKSVWITPAACGAVSPT